LQAVTHQSTNPAWHRVTSLIDETHYRYEKPPMELANVSQLNKCLKKSQYVQQQQQQQQQQ